MKNPERPSEEPAKCTQVLKCRFSPRYHFNLNSRFLLFENKDLLTFIYMRSRLVVQYCTGAINFS